MLQSQTAAHRSKYKSGPFKLHLHPKDYFHDNPYFNNKPLPPAEKPLPATKQFSIPFKPSSPTKQVMMADVDGGWMICPHLSYDTGVLKRVSVTVR